MMSQVGGEKLWGKRVASSSPLGVSLQVGNAGEGRRHLGVEEEEHSQEGWDQPGHTGEGAQ